MITQVKARCVRCDTRFDVRQGSGPKFHLLHCSRCGREAMVSMKGFSEFCRQSLNEFIGCCTTPASGMNSRQLSKGDVAPVDERKYRIMVEHRAGVCVCGALFRFSGKARCPRCRSSVYRIEPDSCTPEPLTQ